MKQGNHWTYTLYSISWKLWFSGCASISNCNNKLKFPAQLVQFKVQVFNILAKCIHIALYNHVSWIDSMKDCIQVIGNWGGNDSLYCCMRGSHAVTSFDLCFAYFVVHLSICMGFDSDFMWSFMAEGVIMYNRCMYTLTCSRLLCNIHAVLLTGYTDRWCSFVLISSQVLFTFILPLIKSNIGILKLKLMACSIIHPCSLLAA